MTASYVTIEISDRKPLNFRPFKLALQPIKTRSGKTSTERSMASVWCYAFAAKDRDVEYVKVGFSSVATTYGSKNRFCPWIDYDGVLQIQRYGRMHEVLVQAYLGEPFKNSEWFVGALPALAELTAALRRNSCFQKEQPKRMKNVTDFTDSFTGTAGSEIDAHLSVYRLRYKGKLYKLTNDNVDKSLSVITGLPEEKTKRKSRKK